MTNDNATCPGCGQENPKFQLKCSRCGQALAGGLVAPEEPTIRLSGSSPILRIDRRPAPAVTVEKLFGSKTRLVIGRASDCDLYLPHPSVSRRHALLDRLPEGIRLRDLESVNGVLVGGQRLTEPVFLRERERFGIGPFLFCLAEGILYSLDNSRSLRLEARGLEKVVEATGGGKLKLLDGINLAVEPGEFISLLGPSGSGKSTLMDCLNGRRPATGGQVLANGEDFYLHFDSFRQSLGYVPQKDIVHTQLTVARALYYTARLRLPTDTGPAELAARIQEVVEQMELKPHRDTLVGNLSGGQVKRVSLGAELLAHPCMLYIDEATSGLDAGTEARMMHLFRRLADEGKSIVCITHNVDNVDVCNLILMLMRGRLVFFGPPADARSYFGVPRLSDIYDRLAEKEPGAWEQQFRSTALYQEFVARRLASAPPQSAQMLAPAPTAAAPASTRAGQGSAAAAPVDRSSTASQLPSPALWHQFRVLTARYAELVLGDRRSLRLLLLQAPIVAVFILLGFINKPYQHKVLAPRQLEPSERQVLESLKPILESHDPQGKATQVVRGILETQGPVVPDKVIIDPRFTYMLLYMLIITILWIGCSNAAKEIVKEEAIYSRERAVNLGILPYLASKFLVLSLISAVQVLMIMGVIYGVLIGLHEINPIFEVPPLDYRLGYVAQFAVLVLLAITGVSLGLLLSACVSTTDRANTLLPYVLIPQIILGGGIIPVRNEPLHGLAMVASPAYWAFRAVRRGATTLPPDLPVHMDYNDSVGLASAALLAQIVVLLFFTAWFLRRKDVHKG